MARLEDEVRAFLAERGAVSVGFATLETLAGGPPSADLTYMLSEARSAVSFVLPMERGPIRDHFSKKDCLANGQDHIDKTMKAGYISKDLAKWLEEKGYKSARVFGNKSYRKIDGDGNELILLPDLSHRYIAVASGAGSFGWSGNVGVKGYGTAVILGSVVTSAEFEPTPPIPPEESFCDNCKICASSCPSSMFHKKDEMSVSVGGVTYTHSARVNYTLCFIACGGSSGLHKSGKWSSWSPGRYAIPEDPNGINDTYMRAKENQKKWPKREEPNGLANPEGNGVFLTCGHCQIVCWGNREDTLENYRLLASSGCVIQRPSGKIEVLPPDEAATEFEKMDPQHRDLYR
jgi:epoxyqueuosine reductase